MHEPKFVVQSTSAKSDDSFGKFFAYVIMFVFFLGAVQVAAGTVSAWYQATMLWLTSMANYLSGFWPF